MPRVRRLFVAIVVGCSLATLGPVSGSEASSSPPDGPSLAFTGFAELRASGFTVNTIGYEASRPRVTLRGSRSGVSPNPLSGLAWSADGEMLAFTGSKGEKSGIYVVRADGTGVHLLRGTKGGSNPVFSPDGSRIAFAREGSSGGRLFASTPWVARVDGGGARRLLGWHKNVTYTPASFSPDGSTLAITEEVFASDEPKILLFRLDRRAVRPLVERASEPEFSPGGAQIAFVKHSIERQGKFKVAHKDLFTMGVDGKGLRRLTRTPWVAETYPSWDPSGQRIAFNSFRISRDPIDRLFDGLLPEGNSIVQMNADGTCREKLFSQRLLGIYGAKWRPGPGREAGRIECGTATAGPPAPQGPRLAVVTGDISSFRTELTTIDETGALPLRLAGGGEGTRPLPEWFEAPSWSPDGLKIAFSGLARSFESGPSGVRLYVVGANGRDIRPLRGTHGSSSPVFTADGSAVAFSRYRFRPTVNRRGKKEFTARSASIWLASLAGDAPRRITPERKGLFLFPASFLPGGKRLLATRLSGQGPEEAVSIRLDSGKMSLLLHRAAEPIASPDGTRVALTRWQRLGLSGGKKTRASDLFTIGIDGKGLRQITKTRRRDELFPSWNPSGERLAFVRNPPVAGKLTELDNFGIGGKIMQANVDGSCMRTLLGPSPSTGLYGAVWQPGSGREAGRIEC